MRMQPCRHVVVKFCNSVYWLSKRDPTCARTELAAAQLETVGKKEKRLGNVRAKCEGEEKKGGGSSMYVALCM